MSAVAPTTTVAVTAVAKWYGNVVAVNDITLSLIHI